MHLVGGCDLSTCMNTISFSLVRGIFDYTVRTSQFLFFPSLSLCTSSSQPISVFIFPTSPHLNILYICTTNLDLNLHVAWRPYFHNYQPAARFTCGRLVLKLLCVFHICWYIYIYIYICLCVRTYHVRNNYVTYIVAMRPYFSQLRQFRQLLCVAAMSSLPQLRDRDGY